MLIWTVKDGGSGQKGNYLSLNMSLWFCFCTSFFLLLGYGENPNNYVKRKGA